MTQPTDSGLKACPFCDRPPVKNIAGEQCWCPAGCTGAFSLERWNIRANTRPTPAPLDGEPVRPIVWMHEFTVAGRFCVYREEAENRIEMLELKLRTRLSADKPILHWMVLEGYPTLKHYDQKSVEDLESYADKLLALRQGKTGTSLERLKAPAVTEKDSLIDALGTQIDGLYDDIRKAIDELGDPTPCPAPIYQARKILLYALMNGQCPPCDMGENTECVCPPPAPLSSEAVGLLIESSKRFISEWKAGRVAIHTKRIEDGNWLPDLEKALALLTPSPTAHPSSEAVERVEKLEVVASVAAKLIQDYEDDEEGEDVMLLALNVDDLRDAINAIPNAIDKALLTPSPSEKEKP